MIPALLRNTLAALALCAPACLAEPITVETATGPVELSQRPERILAMDVPAIDPLTALGVKPAGIVAPTHMGYLSDMESELPVVGTLFEPDFEQIAALGPDAIILGTRSIAQGKNLSNFGPVLDMSIGLDAVGDGLQRLETYGRLTGTEEKAAEMAEVLRDKTETARALVEGQGTALIVMTNGPKLSVFGAESRFGWLHKTLGWPEAADGIDSSSHGEAITFEYIADKNPDTLIVIDRGQAIGGAVEGARSTLDNALIHGTSAWQNDQVIYLSPGEIYIAGGGYTALNRTLDQLIEALGPES